MSHEVFFLPFTFTFVFFGAGTVKSVQPYTAESMPKTGHVSVAGCLCCSICPDSLSFVVL